METSVRAVRASYARRGVFNIYQGIDGRIICIIYLQTVQTSYLYLFARSSFSMRRYPVPGKIAV